MGLLTGAWLGQACACLIDRLCRRDGEGSATVKVATGWIDGAVRIFDVENHEDGLTPHGLAHSLLHENEDEDFVQRDPLLDTALLQYGRFADKVNVSRWRLVEVTGQSSSGISWQGTGLFHSPRHRWCHGYHYLNLPSWTRWSMTTSLDGLGGYGIWMVGGVVRRPSLTIAERVTAPRLHAGQAEEAKRSGQTYYW
jgi:hypothetical protein